MTRHSWKNRQPSSLRQAMEWCLEHARAKHNRSVDHVADLMGLPNKWVVYKWLENGRLPALLIRPFETACDIEYVTKYIGHSAHKLVIDMPTGNRVKGRDINDLQASFTTAVGLLIQFYDGESNPDDTLSALVTTMEQLAWHRAEVQRNQQPDLELCGGDA